MVALVYLYYLAHPSRNPRSLEVTSKVQVDAGERLHQDLREGRGI